MISLDLIKKYLKWISEGAVSAENLKNFKFKILSF